MSRTSPHNSVAQFTSLGKFPFRLFGIFLAGFFFLALQHFAFADTDENIKNTEPIGEIIVTADRDKTKAITDKPASSSVVITLSDKRDRYIELKDILSEQLGIHVREFSGSGHLATINIRGVSAKGILVMIDGVPINGLWATGVDLSRLPLGGFESVEIYKGGGGAFYGDSALGGAVNLVTAKSQKAKNHLALTFGSFSLVELKSIMNFQSEKGNLMIALDGASSLGNYPFLNNNGTSLDSSDDFSDKRANNESDSLGCLLKYSHNLGEESRFSVVTEINRARRGVPGLLTFPSPNARQTDERIFFQTLMEKDNVLNHTDGAFRLFFRNDILDYEDKFGEATGSPIDTHASDDLFGIGAKITRYDANGNGLLAGSLEMSHEALNQSGNTKPGRSKATLSIEREKHLQSGKSVLHLASRLDSIEGYNPQATFRIGASHRQSEKSAWRASVGNSFRVPGFDELYDNRGLIVGNPKLTPEKGFDFDLGFSRQGDSSAIGITLFSNHLKNQIVYELIGGHRFKPFNVGKSDMAGVEIAMKKQIENITLSANYTWLDARNRGDDAASKNKQLPSRPEHELFAQIATAFDPVKLECNYHYASGNYVTFSNTVELKPRSRVDLRLKWNRDDWTIAGEIRNLFNNDMLDIRGFPLPARSFYLTLSHEF